MNELIDSLPSVRNMFKLILFLILVLIVIGLVGAIVKTLMPVLLLGAIVAAAWYLLSKRQTSRA